MFLTTIIDKIIDLKNQVNPNAVSGLLLKISDLSDPKFEQRVNLEDLKSGIYLNTLRGEPGETKTSKLIILK